MKLDVGRIRVRIDRARMLLVALLCAMLATALPVTAASPHKIRPGRLVVRMTHGANAHRVATDDGLKILSHIQGTDLYLCDLHASARLSMSIRRLSKDKRVVYAEPDEPSVCEAFRKVGTDHFHFAFVDGFDSSGYVNQDAYTQIDFVPGVTGGSGPGVGQGTLVAVLDTGATFEHPALYGHYVRGVNVVTPGTPPFDIPDGTTNVAVGHGTMVTGIITMLDPSARIMPVRVLNGDGVGTVFNVVTGIYAAINQGVQIIHMSLGTNEPSTALYEAVMEAEEAGITVVASAGNSGANVPHYPASYPGVMSVASVESNDTLSPFSNYGPTITALAPGDGITSTYYNGGYATWAGTSFSAPFLTGMVSLLLEQNPNLSNDELCWIVWASSVSVDSLNPGLSGLLGAGVLDVGTALSY